MTNRKLSFAGRISRWAAAFIGMGLASTAPAAAQSVSPSAAPAEWVAYAQSATETVTAWLQADGEIAKRLRAYFDATRPAPNRATAPLVLKIWIDGDGAVSRIDFPPFAHPEPNDDLRSLVVGQRLAAAPPRDMLLPLRIAVQLDPPAAHAPEPAPMVDSRNSPQGTLNRI